MNLKAQHSFYELQDFNKSLYGWYNDPDKIASLKEAGVLSEAFTNALPEITSILQHIYPNKWDIHFYPITESNSVAYMATHRLVKIFTDSPLIMYAPVVIIHFPVLVIADQEGRTHTITDLYVYFPIATIEDKLLLSVSLRGLRTSSTTEEFDSHFIFSHISGNYNDLRPYSTCLGSGEILEIIMRFNVENNMNLFKMFLFQLELLYSWESEDGGPYKRIKDLTGGQEFENGKEESSFYNQMAAAIIQNPEKPFSLDIENGTFVVKVDRQFHEYALSVMKGLTGHSIKLLAQRQYIVERAINGTYVITTDNAPRESSNTIVFKGEVVTYKTLNTGSQNKVYYANPNIINNVTKQLNSHLSKKTIENGIYQKLQSTHNY